MQSLLVLALSLLPAAFAAPASDSAMAKRTPGNVYLCNAENWGGDCNVVYFPLDTCQTLPEEYIFTLGSIGPDAGAICALFASDDGNCGGTGLYSQILTPGVADLYDPSLGNPGGAAYYIQCNECTACT